MKSQGRRARKTRTPSIEVKVKGEWTDWRHDVAAMDCEEGEQIEEWRAEGKGL